MQMACCVLKCLWSTEDDNNLTTSCTSQYLWWFLTRSFHSTPRALFHHAYCMWRPDGSEHYTHHVLTCQLILQSPLTEQQTPAEPHIRTQVAQFQSLGSDSSFNTVCTYSRYLVHGAGSDMAMKKQLVSIVNIMNRLNNVETRLRKVLWNSNLQLNSRISFCDKPTMYHTMFLVILWNIPIRINHQCVCRRY